jgi:5,10-methylenetetrahydromethanopterin reductase
MIPAGINLIPETAISEMVDLAMEAERLGFQRCWVYDEGLVTRDVHVTMTAIAAATDTLLIGPGITNPYTRHPAQTASAIASLDEMSGGRAFLGVGAGGSLTLDPIGLERTRPLTAVRESIEVARGLFSGSAVSYQGETVVLSSATMAYGRQDIQIWLAGRGPRMLGLGGATADGVMLDFVHVDTLGDYVELIRDGAATTGNRPRVCYSTAIVTDEDDLEFVRPHMTYRLVDAPPAVKDRLGLTPADVARIRSAMADGLAAAAEHVRDEWVLPFVISGSIAECGERLGSLMEGHDIDEFLLPMFEMPDPRGYLGRIARVLDLDPTHP